MVRYAALVVALLAILASQRAAAAPRASEGPMSSYCRMFGGRYKRYFRAKNHKEFWDYGQKAQAGDMIELVPGRHLLGDGKTGPDGPATNYGPSDPNKPGLGPTVSVNGTIFGRKGTAANPIIFCGSKDTILDGADAKMYWPYCIRVVKSKYVRVAGFTLQNALKGIDVQATTDSEFSELTTRNTLQEGIRLRYNSQYNVVKRCRVSNTGLMYAGVGEGAYIGTSVGNSIEWRRPADRSHYNTLRNNVFGPGVKAEAVDIKEFTKKGVVAYNTFDGSALAGENGAISWVVVKGSDWTIANNTGRNLRAGNYVGYRAVELVPGEGRDNTFSNNKCGGNLRSAAYCIYIDPEAPGNWVGCSNTVLGRSRAGICNCRVSCGAKRDAETGGAQGYAVPGLADADTEPEVRPYDWL